jgi:2-haloacid dehalogenase
MSRSRVLAFDVNETLLDLDALDEAFGAALGDARLRRLWFAQMLQLSFVGGLTGRYVDFTTAQRAALRMVAAQQGMDLDPEAVDELVARMRRLPAHPEVPGALSRLADAGFRLATLTNSPLDVVTDQLEFAGLGPLFAAVLSADQVGTLKPAAAPYHLVAHSLGVPVPSVRLIAAHAWDVSGALAAGCAAAFVARRGAVPSPLGPQPDIVGPDLTSVADQVLAIDID